MKECQLAWPSAKLNVSLPLNSKKRLTWNHELESFPVFGKGKVQSNKAVILSYLVRLIVTGQRICNTLVFLGYGRLVRQGSPDSYSSMQFLCLTNFLAL